MFPMQTKQITRNERMAEVRNAKLRSTFLHCSTRKTLIIILIRNGLPFCVASLLYICYKSAISAGNFRVVENHELELGIGKFSINS